MTEKGLLMTEKNSRACAYATNQVDRRNVTDEAQLPRQPVHVPHGVQLVVINRIMLQIV